MGDDRLSGVVGGVPVGDFASADRAGFRTVGIDTIGSRAASGSNIYTFGASPSFQPSGGGGGFAPGAGGTQVTPIDPGGAVPPVSDIPEPVSWALLTAGFALIGIALRKRQERSVEGHLVALDGER